MGRSGSFSNVEQSEVEATDSTINITAMLDIEFRTNSSGFQYFNAGSEAFPQVWQECFIEFPCLQSNLA